jgi:hypothetical protein
MRISISASGASPFGALALSISLLASGACHAQADKNQPLRTGQSAFTDWSQQAPGVRHKITVAAS